MRYLKVLRTLTFLLFFVGAGLGVHSQNIENLFFNSSNNITRLDFSSTPPAIIYTGINNGFEAIAHAEDGNGNILFWVNASGVYDVGGAIMAGSAGILASNSSAEIVICPNPANADQFYIIYNDEICSPLYYCIVDMTLNGGLGNVVPGSLNTLFGTGNYAEGLEVVRKSTGCVGLNEFWLVAYECDTQFKRWTIDVAGIHSPTNILAWSSAGGNYDGRGELDYHNGRLGLAVTYYQNCFLGDFDPILGTLTNPVTIVINQPGGSSFQDGAYGVEFSPNGTKAYFTSWGAPAGQSNLFVYDWNTATLHDTLIIHSGSSLGQIEMGKDLKLYIIAYFSNQIIVIQNPDVAPSNLIWNPTSLNPAVNLGYGISDHIQSDILAITVTVRDTMCNDGTTYAKVPEYFGPTIWTDVNGAIVGTGDSIILPLVPGTYTGTGTDSCGNVNIYKIYGGYIDPTITTPITTFCEFDTVSLAAGVAHTYLWSPPTGLNCIDCQAPRASPIPGSYTYQVILQDTIASCIDTNTIDITVNPKPTGGIQAVPNQCVDGGPINFNNLGVYGPTATFNWFFPGGTPASSTDENPVGIVYNTPGIKTVNMVVTEKNCQSITATTTFEIYKMPDPAFVSIGSAQCLSSNSYCLITTGTNGPNTVYNWTFQNALPANSSQPAPCGIIFNSGGYHQIDLQVTDNGCISNFSDSLLVLNNPVANAGVDVSFCEGEGGSQLQASASGVTSTLYYTWWCDTSCSFCGLDSNFIPTPNANPTCNTTYFLQVTDNNGCISNIDSTVVVVRPKPIVDAGPDIYVCADSAPCQIIQANVTGLAPGPYNYQWFPTIGLNNDTIQNPCARPDTTTIYTLVVGSSNGCTSDFTTTDTLSSVLVHVNKMPIAIAHDPSPIIDICLGESVMLQGVGHSAGPVYGYQWSPTTGLSNQNIANPIASPIITTDYVLTVWSNGCPSYGDTVEVNVHTNPTVTASPGNIDICLGETANLTSTAWGDPSSATYGFEWTPIEGMITSPNLANPTVQPDTTTAYYVVATSVWGCESPADSIVITVIPTPLADAGPDQVICYGDSITLPGSVYYTTTPPVANPGQIFYSWAPAATLDNAILASPSAKPFVTTVYELTVQWTTCISKDEVIISVFPEINAALDADTNRICSGQAVQMYGFGGLGGASFTWTPPLGLDDPNFQNPLASPDTTTNYMLVVSEGGCNDTVEMVINVIPTPEAAYLNSLAEGCPGLNVNFLETTHDAQYWVWDFGDGSPVSNEQNPTHTYNSSGMYEVTMTAIGQGACAETISSTTVTIFEGPVADFHSDPEFPVQLAMPNTNVQFWNDSENAISYFWDFGDKATSDEKHPSHIFETAGDYMVTLAVTTNKGCINEITLGPYFVLSPELFVPNIFSPNNDGDNDQFVIRYTGSQPFALQIFDRWGNMHYESTNKLEGWNGNSADGNVLAEGVYFYTVGIGSRTFSGNLTLLR